jgi:hypothetical protein
MELTYYNENENESSVRFIAGRISEEREELRTIE